jgi:zinc transport system permease protein
MRLALVAAIATGVSLGVMGTYLVMRRVVFLGLVVANAATLGAALARTAGWSPNLLSLGAATAAAVLFSREKSSTRMSAESLMGWAYAAVSSATVLLLSSVSGGSADTLHLLFGNVLAVETTGVVVLTAVAVMVVAVQLLFGRRFLLVTFDPEAATVAGVKTRLWSFILNLTIGLAAATAVQAIGALPTFGLLTLPAVAALLAARSVRTTFATAAVLSISVPSLALAGSFYLDLPPGPASVALLAIGVPMAAGANRVATRWRRHT